MSLKDIKQESEERMREIPTATMQDYKEELMRVVEALKTYNSQLRRRSTVATVVHTLVEFSVSEFLACPNREVYENLIEVYGHDLTAQQWYERTMEWLHSHVDIMKKYNTAKQEYDIYKKVSDKARNAELKIFRKVWKWEDEQQCELSRLCESAQVQFSKPFIEILQRWNSCTPALQGGGETSHEEVGGGMLFWDGHSGLAVDPGYDFLRNYFESGWRLSTLSGVFMTHAHDDHTADLEKLISIWYKCNKLFGDDIHKLKIFCTRNTLRKYEQLSQGTTAICDWIPVVIGEEIVVGNMRIQSFLVKHNEAPFENGNISESVGIYVGFEEGNASAAAYLGDTSYCEELKEHIADAKTVVLNIGTAGVGSDNHLGVHGCGKVIADTIDQDRVYIISEWMREAYGERQEMIETIASIVNLRSGIAAKEVARRVIPAEIFMRVGLDYAERHIGIPGDEGWVEVGLDEAHIRECRMRKGMKLCFLR